jgi:hypothetical protein
VKCGDRGFTTADGRPCGQVIGKKAAGCIWHTSSPEGRRAFAMKGGIASRMRRYLPAEAPPPEFSNTVAIVAWAERTAQRVLAGELDPRAASEARQLAALTISARAADAQERLVEALLRVEHGGAALLMLSRLQEGLADGRRRPLPGRAIATTATVTSAATEPA